MHDVCSGDDDLAALAMARPEPPAALVSAESPTATALLDRIVSGEARAAQAHGGGWRVRLSAAAAAVVVLVVVAGGLAGGDRNSRPAPPAEVELTAAEVQRIAAVSATALGGSGRAEVGFHVDAGLRNEQRGSARLAFAGEDLDMVLRFDGQHGRPGFEAANRTVDGRFYLLDGPPDAKRRVRDDNAGERRGSDLFSLDPRTLLGAVQPGGGFVVVGTDEADDLRLRHLRATRLDRLPELNLSLGPIDPASVKTLDVWVDDAGVVRRLDLTTASSETHPAGMLEKVVGPDGRIKGALEGGTGTVTTEHRATYSVRFFDIGAPVDISAPADAAAVRGLG